MLRVVRVGQRSAGCRWGGGSALRSPHNKSLAPAAPAPGWTQCIDHTNTRPPPVRERELSPPLLCPVASLCDVEMEAAPGQGPATHIWHTVTHPSLTSLLVSWSLMCVTPDSCHLLGRALDILTSPGVPSALSAGPLVWWAMTRQGPRLSLLQNTQQKGERERPRPGSLVSKYNRRRMLKLSQAASPRPRLHSLLTLRLSNTSTDKVKPSIQHQEVNEYWIN